MSGLAMVTALLLTTTITAAVGNDTDAAAITVDVNTATGGYTVKMNGVPWFENGPTFYTAGHTIKSTADGTLQLSSVSIDTVSRRAFRVLCYRVTLL
jgi:hypothetical protein